MRIFNVHERELPVPPDQVGALIDSLSSAHDALWPGNSWPRMAFDRPLQMGANGGHGPIRYFVESYAPGRSINFRFTGPMGFNGHHRFEVLEKTVGSCVLRHTVEMEANGSAVLSWPIVFQPMHDALIEDSLAQAQAWLGQPPLVRQWSAWVKFLRWLVSKGQARAQVTPNPIETNEISRRTFLRCTGTIVFAFGGGSYLLSGLPFKATAAQTAACDGYLVVDTRKCQGCISCMLACSLVHNGLENPSLSRIQILQNPFEKFPEDLAIEQCRQCTDPACVQACPENALTANAAFGNVRMVDKEKCTGCGSCFDACPYTPKRIVVMEDERFNRERKSQKCDLCAGARFHFDETGGGPEGKQACVEVCPVNAIQFTRKVPIQEGTSGYKINLRGAGWESLGYRDWST